MAINKLANQHKKNPNKFVFVLSFEDHAKNQTPIEIKIIPKKWWRYISFFKNIFEKTAVQIIEVTCIILDILPDVKEMLT